MRPLEEYLEHVDTLVQTVVNEWAIHTKAGNGSALTDEFMNLFDRADDYIKAKRGADNHREFNALTEDEATEEQTTRRAFAETYKNFWEKHQGRK